jgi:hypothetical protein
VLVHAEVLDFGYPQNCALEVLQAYINFGNVRVSVCAMPLPCISLVLTHGIVSGLQASAGDGEAEKMTSYITGTRDWYARVLVGGFDVSSCVVVFILSATLLR